MTSEQLKKWRTQNGYSQSQLAKALTVSIVTISRWERREREIPSFLHLALKALPKGGGIRVGRPVGSKTKRRTGKEGK